MTIITVSGMITDGEQVLLMQAPESATWLLPGGLLETDDGTVEDALLRTLAALGIEVTACDFLDTLYERRADQVLVHNVFAVGAIAGGLPEAVRHGDTILAWVRRDAMADLPLPLWLAEALPSLLEGGAAPAGEVDMAALAGALGAEVRAKPDRGGVAAGTVWIVTGPAGAGKSSVARALCARFVRAAHIEVDVVRHMVLSGYASPVPGEAEPVEAERQEELAHRNASLLARSFAEAGFHVVIDDVLEQPRELDHYLGCLAGLDVAFVTLLPDAATVRRRDEARALELRMGGRAAHLHETIAGNGETRGLRLDTSAWDVEQTVDIILARRDEARVAAPVAGTD